MDLPELILIIVFSSLFLICLYYVIKFKIKSYITVHNRKLRMRKKLATIEVEPYYLVSHQIQYENQNVETKNEDEENINTKYHIDNIV